MQRNLRKAERTGEWRRSSDRPHHFMGGRREPMWVAFLYLSPGGRAGGRRSGRHLRCHGCGQRFMARRDYVCQLSLGDSLESATHAASETVIFSMMGCSRFVHGSCRYRQYLAETTRIVRYRISDLVYGHTSNHLLLIGLRARMANGNRERDLGDESSACK